MKPVIEKIFYNGHVLTQDRKQPLASSFSVADGKIVATGTDVGFDIPPDIGCERIDLNGASVLPGFNDAHIHIWKVGSLLTSILDLRGVQSIQEMLHRLREHAAKKPELQWIQARGFNEALFSDGRMPDRNDLDRVVSDRPVCVMRTCAHQIVVNTKALQAAGITKDTAEPFGGKITKSHDGHPNGHLAETALGLILNRIPPFSHEEYRLMILAAQEKLLQAGITSATDPAVYPGLLEVYKTMNRNAELKIRVNAIPVRVPDGAQEVLPMPELLSSPFLKIDTVKFFADGGLSGKTAAMYQPYRMSDGRGILRLEKSAFRKWASESQKKGFRIATHAIGDEAMDLVCTVYEELYSEFGMRGNRIEHVGLPSAVNLKQMQRMMISAVMQPVFIYELGRNFRENLDPERLRRIYPLRSVLDCGINLALSTDAPVVSDFNPWRNISAAVNRMDDEGHEIGAAEKISLEQALFAYTAGSAIANNDEEVKGSLSAGKFADFVVLDQRAASPDASGIVMPGIAQVYVHGKRCALS